VRTAGLIALLGWAITGSGQYTDVECWLGTGVGQSLNKSWSWSLQWENRWTQDATWHDQGLIDASLEYRLNKHWDVNAQWRFSERQQLDGGYLPQQRGALRLLGGWKVGSGKVRFRLMGSEDWLPTARAEGVLRDWNPEPTLRIRWGYEQELSKRLDAVASWEVFVRNNGRKSERWQAAVTYAASKQINVKAAYLWGNEWGISDPWRSHVLRIQLNWKLPDAQKRTWRRIPPARVYDDGVVQRLVPSACEPCTKAQLVVTEVHTRGSRADYIEIQNAGLSPCDLGGWRMTDDPEKEGFVFNTACLPTEMMWLGYQGGRNSFDFGLSAEGELLYLFSPSGEDRLIYSLLFNADGRPQGFQSTGTWDFISPSPGHPNFSN